MVFKVQNGVLHDQNGGFYRFYVHDDDAFYDVFYGRGHYGRSYRSCVHVCGQSDVLHGRSVLSGASRGRCGRSYHSCDQVCGVHGRSVQSGVLRGRSCNFYALVCPHGHCVDLRGQRDRSHCQIGRYGHNCHLKLNQFHEFVELNIHY